MLQGVTGGSGSEMPCFRRSPCLGAMSVSLYVKANKMQIWLKNWHGDRTRIVFVWMCRFSIGTSLGVLERAGRQDHGCSF